MHHVESGGILGVVVFFNDRICATCHPYSLLHSAFTTLTLAHLLDALYKGFSYAAVESLVSNPAEGRYDQ